MQLLTKLSTVDDTYSLPEFQSVLEQHLEYFKVTGTISTLTISDHQSLKYQGDLYGIFEDVNIAKKFHYLVMRLNGFTHPGDYAGDSRVLILPDFQEVELVKNVWQTKKF